MKKTTKYLAIPSWEALMRAGDSRKAESITILEWDLHREMVREGDRLLILANVRGDRKELRETLKWVYGFEAETVVR